MKNQDKFAKAMKDADSIKDIARIAIDISSSATSKPFMTEICFLMTILLYMKTLYEEDKLTLSELIRQLREEADIYSGIDLNDHSYQTAFDVKMYEVKKIIESEEPNEQGIITIKDNNGDPVEFKAEYISSMFDYYKAFRCNPNARKILSWALMDTALYYNDLDGYIEYGAYMRKRRMKRKNESLNSVELNNKLLNNKLSKILDDLQESDLDTVRVAWTNSRGDRSGAATHVRKRAVIEILKALMNDKVKVVEETILITPEDLGSEPVEETVLVLGPEKKLIKIKDKSSDSLKNNDESKEKKSSKILSSFEDPVEPYIVTAGVAMSLLEKYGLVYDESTGNIIDLVPDGFKKLSPITADIVMEKIQDGDPEVSEDPVKLTEVTADLAMQMLQSCGWDNEPDPIRDAVESKFDLTNIGFNITDMDVEKSKTNKKQEDE